MSELNFFLKKSARMKWNLPFG